MNGVYVPAMSRKIAQWSRVFSTRLARTAEMEWYRVEAR